MRIIADLHLHSKYSRACSKDLDLEHNQEWAQIKGINVVGTADFTHPGWFKELQSKLVESNPGLFQLRPGVSISNSNFGAMASPVLFMLTTEVSCIYKQGDKVRRLHLCLFAPSFAAVAKINQALLKRGVNLSSDGRPIMGLSAEEVAKIVLDADPDCLVVPAHAWTPWFSVFGSKSGFDSLAECFGRMTKYIYAIETGLSSDPAMNWSWSALDKITLLSNSDAHSPQNLGREANVFEIAPVELSYNEIRRIIKEKDQKKFLYTIEFFPEEGKYHFDGHRDCRVSFSPDQAKKSGGLCPVCHKELTMGVNNRVYQLADREIGYKFDTIPYKSLVPLPELIAEVLGVGKASKKVMAAYAQLIRAAGNEFKILLDLPLEDLSRLADPAIVAAISNVRSGQVDISPGYDGVYGTVSALTKQQKAKPKQKSLF